ncbi:GNAT family N-acetyltransferase [Staphylococcus shinii]|uniref:GNAT family N-acetyltransferase n=1 Tax=Staphylococcus shinii TaxID=2912228 RepID=UPI003EB9EC76
MSLQEKNVNKDSSDLKHIESLLKNSFPEVERFPMDLILYKLEKDIGNLLAIYDDDNFIGFTYLIQYNNLTYVQYLAVDDKYQSMGYGSKILQFINEKYGMNPIILNIEIVDPTFENYLQRKKEKIFIRKMNLMNLGLYLKIDGEHMKLW